jgi:hypothetical protein
MSDDDQGEIEINFRLTTVDAHKWRLVDLETGKGWRWVIRDGRATIVPDRENRYQAVPRNGQGDPGQP